MSYFILLHDFFGTLSLNEILNESVLTLNEILNESVPTWIFDLVIIRLNKQLVTQPFNSSWNLKVLLY